MSALAPTDSIPTEPVDWRVELKEHRAEKWAVLLFRRTDCPAPTTVYSTNRP
jgi:hypothetical protein